ncbi:MAG: hypothetical protein EA425_02910 [Puniceicoccaceae bacterium]|nr:MAG: hypothetical protein EA425_02910 [Puniceicoccaceae bacterium]
MRSLLPALLGLALLASGFTGCAGYRLTHGAPLPFNAVHVEPVTLSGPVPQARSLVHAAVSRELSRDGRLDLRSAPDAAAARLHISLAPPSRTYTADRPDDAGLSRKLVLSLTATCTLSSADGATVYFAERPVTASIDLFTDDGQIPAEYQALSPLADELGRRIAQAVLDVW